MFWRMKNIYEVFMPSLVTLAFIIFIQNTLELFFP